MAGLAVTFGLLSERAEPMRSAERDDEPQDRRVELPADPARRRRPRPALAGVFGLALAEPVMDQAVRLESAREEAASAAQHAAGQVAAQHVEVFSRGTQHAGLLVASLVTGLALGVLFGVLYAVRHRTDPTPGTGRDGWRRAAGGGR